MKSTFSTQDEQFMEEALNMARKALNEFEVPVGCVITYENNIIGRGYNKTNQTKNATRHAEFEAFDDIFNNFSHLLTDASFFTKCTLYVTVEPCVMCASALLILKIGKVICGCMNERFGGCGSVLNIHQHGIPHTNCISNTSSGDDATVDHNHLLHDETSPIWKDQDHSNNQNWYTYECLNGLFEEEAIEILQRFYEQENPSAPVPKPKQKGSTLEMGLEKSTKKPKQDTEYTH
ncbi:hypothetical protein FDP41_010848 [Naegleria fowleri]|uniref:CMP/dCMP-type deaminase domain-containing protein n=1 Tax=Naegleria fowleri TaxID=5763 RepID=A0A6A5CC93_NAEFO|nr:uncharacterized protein FDP41_010848 [Naegleria fowleri]KAF0982869.1 hypothetical protein FDP41_010848 [Naegleria fowleri]CAG4707667.1 unnamed protein product [Naegleria fowleri]